MKDSNLRYPCGYNTLAGCRFKPLSQSSVVVLTGIEPVTHGFSVHCSTYWAIIPFCTPVRTRTWNHRFWRPTFYQLNYRRVLWWFFPSLTPILGLNAGFIHHCSPWRIWTLTKTSVVFRAIHYTKGLNSSRGQTRTADPSRIRRML